MSYLVPFTGQHFSQKAKSIIVTRATGLRTGLGGCTWGGLSELESFPGIFQIGAWERSIFFLGRVRSCRWSYFLSQFRGKEQR